MAQKRMFDKRVIESDKFTDLPNSSKALYFMAGMSADDKGFFQPRRLQRMCGFSDDDFKILIAKNFFITFPSGVMVVTDWNKNNWLDSRRITETEYVEELNLLKLINEKYEFKDECADFAKPMLSENSIEENSIEEYSIYAQNDAKCDTSISALFSAFWSAFPKKKDKAKAQKWFEKNKPSKELVDLMLKQIERFKDTEDWKKENGKYIPYPTTWLNGRRWEDEFETEKEKDDRIQKEVENDLY